MYVYIYVGKFVDMVACPLSQLNTSIIDQRSSQSPLFFALYNNNNKKKRIETKKATVSKESPLSMLSLPL